MRLTAVGLWSTLPRAAQASLPPHSPRGELVRVDASKHEWVAGRRWVLQVFVDGATLKILHARFARPGSFVRAWQWWGSAT